MVGGGPSPFRSRQLLKPARERGAKGCFVSCLILIDEHRTADITHTATVSKCQMVRRGFQAASASARLFVCFHPSRRILHVVSIYLSFNPHTAALRPAPKPISARSITPPAANRSPFDSAYPAAFASSSSTLQVPLQLGILFLIYLCPFPVRSLFEGCCPCEARSTVGPRGGGKTASSLRARLHQAASELRLSARHSTHSSGTERGNLRQAGRLCPWGRTAAAHGESLKQAS